jgi:hypothetical protein
MTFNDPVALDVLCACAPIVIKQTITNATIVDMAQSDGLRCALKVRTSGAAQSDSLRHFFRFSGEDDLSPL